jgi:integrase
MDDKRVVQVGSDSVVQNFFIIMPGTGPDPLSSEHANNLLNTIRTAVTGAPAEFRPSIDLTFSTVAWEWFENNKPSWVPSYALRLKNRLETGLLKKLGTRPLAAISSADVLEVIRMVEARDARETARRILRIASAVFRYGIATGRCSRDPTVDLKGALRPAKAVRHRAFIAERELPRFLRCLDSYQGELTKLALELILLTFVRTNELRFSKWSEFEELKSGAPIWRIPAARMKMRKTHIVPLADRAVAVLRSIRDLNPRSPYLFPANTKLGVISENTLLFALYRMGYKRRATVHGFRSLASTVLNEAQFNRDWIEMQLAHADNSVRGAYNAAEWLPGRRQMLQWWANYLRESGGGTGI